MTVAVTVVGVLVAAVAWLFAGTASAGTLSGALYRDPNTQVARWVAANPGDSRMPVIRDKIASQPAARWLSNFNISTVQAEVSSYVSAANAVNQLPVLSVYGITNRDCGGASSGGAPDLNQYQTWIGNLARGLGNRTVVIILETDSIALQTCLSSGELAARNQALSTATQTIKAANPSAKVYLDGGHSAWNGASDQANRLRAAGIQFADGFYTNVSNYNATGNEANYGRSIMAALNGFGLTGKRQIIDTSRNGGASGDWCGDDNTDRRIGQYPTTNTGDANIDGYVWVKPPGEADGCRFAAGSFQPELAFSLAQNAPNPPTTPPNTTPPNTTPPVTTPPATTPPVTTPPVTTPPVTTPPPNGGCSATYQTIRSWQGGFQGEVTVRAGAAGTTKWTVSWTPAAGQAITQVWSGTLLGTSPTVRVANAPWNGTIPPNGSTMFGFLANGNPSNPNVSCSTA